MRTRQIIELSESAADRLRNNAVDAKFFLLGKLSHYLIADDKLPSFGALQTFCCFVGHGRSGGTLVGALLNAHPNIVMSNELNALRRLATGLTAQQLYRLIYIISQRQVRRGSKGGGGYTYEVPGQWQGRHEGIQVIGDRKAGATAFEIVRRPRLLGVLARKVTLQRKFVHVIRNPFDTIATTFHKTTPKPGEDSHAHLTREIGNYFARCTAVHLIEREFGESSLLNLYHERLVSDPATQLRGLCSFLGVTASDDYLRDCGSIVMRSPHQSRMSLDWSERHISMIRQGITNFRWLRAYEEWQDGTSC